MWIKKSILLFFSTLISIYLVELFLSINHINKLVFKNIKVDKYCIDSKNCDTRSASKLYEDTKKK